MNEGLQKLFKELKEANKEDAFNYFLTIVEDNGMFKPSSVTHNEETKEVVFNNQIARVFFKYDEQTKEIFAVTSSNIFSTERYIWRKAEGKKLNFTKLWNHLD